MGFKSRLEIYKFSFGFMLTQGYLFLTLDLGLAGDPDWRKLLSKQGENPSTAQISSENVTHWYINKFTTTCITNSLKISLMLQYYLNNSSSVFHVLIIIGNSIVWDLQTNSERLFHQLRISFKSLYSTISIPQLTLWGASYKFEFKKYSIIWMGQCVHFCYWGISVYNWKFVIRNKSFWFGSFSHKLKYSEVKSVLKE